MMIQSDIETAYQDRASSPKETSERDSQSATLYWNMQANLLCHGFLSGVSIDARNFQINHSGLVPPIVATAHESSHR